MNATIPRQHEDISTMGSVFSMLSAPRCYKQDKSELEETETLRGGNLYSVLSNLEKGRSLLEVPAWRRVRISPP
jgi:hypothetical protein